MRHSVVACTVSGVSNWGGFHLTRRKTMRNPLVVNITALAPGAAAPMSHRAQATTLGGSAGARAAIEGASPIEEVTYRRYHRRHAYPYRYKFRAYAYHPRRLHRRSSNYD